MVSNPNLSGFIAFLKGVILTILYYEYFKWDIFLSYLFFLIASCVKDDKCYDLVAGQTYEVPCDSQE